MVYFFLVFCALSLPVFAADYSVFYKQESRGYSGPMALLEIADNWSGSLQRGSDGYLFHQQEYGFSINNFSLSKVTRLHGEYRMPYDAARIFYSYNRDIELDQSIEATAKLEAKDYRGSGLRLAYQFQSENFRIQPTVTWLQLDELIWGEWSGDFRYQSRDDWDINIDVDYHYTEDKLIRRGEGTSRPLDINYGNLWALGMNFEWSYQRYTLNYQGENLLAKIDWQNAPATEARASTTGPFFLFGYEIEENKTFRPSADHIIGQSFRVHPSWSLLTESLLNPIRNSHGFGFQYNTKTLALQLLRDNLKAWQLGARYKILDITVRSGAWNPEKSRPLSVDLSVIFSF